MREFGLKTIKKDKSFAQTLVCFEVYCYLCTHQIRVIWCMITYFNNLDLV